MKFLEKFAPMHIIAGLIALHVVLFFAFRLVLGYFIYPNVIDHDAIFKALYIGLKFDTRQVIFLNLISIILLFIPFFERLIIQNKYFRYGVVFWQTLVFAFMLLVYVVDFIVYFYLHQRVDLTLIDLTKEADIGFTMVWQSYPVVWIALAFSAVLIVYFYALNKFLQKDRARPVKRKKNIAENDTFSVKLSHAILLRVLAFVVLFFMGFGQISSNLFPLRWSNAYFSVDKNIPLLAINPIQNLYDTRKSIEFVISDVKFAKEAFPRMAKVIGVADTNELLDFTRTYEASHRDKPVNIVVIMMESWTTPKASLPHGIASKKGFENHTDLPEGYDINPTPFAEKLMENSLYYSNFYANARTTARGIVSTLTGIADVNFGATASSRNPKIVDQHLIFNEFKGYEKYYMIGGNANWANIRGVFTNNIDGLHLLEESFWQAPNTDVWGISDLALLRESVDVLSKSKKPFIAFIQTAGYHRPFTIPSDREDFQLVPAPSEEVLKAWGFVNDAEYQALRFVDYAVQRFFERAKETDWYEDTVFVLFGDHGTTERNITMNSSYQALNLQAWHTPFFIHAPKYVKAGVNPSLHSQRDIYPTVAQLAGIAYKNTTLGTQMLQETEDNMFVPREFTKNEQGEYVYSDELDTKFNNHIYIATNEGQGLILHKNYGFTSSIYDTKGERDFLVNIAKDDPTNLVTTEKDKAKQFRQLTDDYYYTAKYLLLNNHK